VSTGVSWHFNKVRLAEALSLWKATGPDTGHACPSERGPHGPDHGSRSLGHGGSTESGVFHREIVTGTGVRIGILYAIASLEDREVAVADIRTSRGEAD
jgi:hypothetical protein